MSYLHGIYISEVPTSIVPPVEVDSALPVIFVTAPVNLAVDPYAVTNVPKLCYEYSEAVKYFGYNTKPEIWNNYTAVEVINSQFVLFGVAPVVLINVLDPEKHITQGTGPVQLQKLNGVLEIDGVLIDKVKFKKNDTEYYSLGTDYDLSFTNEGYVSVDFYVEDIDDTIVNVEYTKLDPSKVDEYDVIGGYNAITGKNEGLELLNEIYPRFRKVPGQVLAPKFSSNTTVASVMETKAGNINGCFRAMALIDLPSNLKYTELAEHKNNENLVSTRQLLAYPKLRNGEQIYNYSTQLASLICKTDADNGGVPYASPSNQNLKINGLVNDVGDEIILQPEQANYLNSNGIITSINFVKGWTAWGSQTAIYPGSTDIKDATLQIRRMFDWIGNTCVLTYWSKLDLPLTRRNIDTVLDSINIWLNSLTSKGYILGGTASFTEKDNSLINLMNGDIVIKFDITPAPGIKSIEFKQEFNVDNLNNLFAA